MRQRLYRVGHGESIGLSRCRKEAAVHGHGHGGGNIVFWVFVLPFAAAVIGYLVSVAGENRRDREWPLHRVVCWITGCMTVLIGMLGPLGADAGFTGFAGHMTAHVMVGMVAPLLLVLGAPITLALRTLDIRPARRISRMLRSRPARILATPAVAAALNVGSMALLYLTPLHELADVPLFHLAFMAHFLVMGVLFTASVVAVDPNPHRASIRTRLVVLVLALAAHGVVAKLIYAQPLAGIPRPDSELGAQIMFYAGDIVDLALIVLVLAEWYRVSGRRLARRPLVGEVVR